MTPYDSWMVLGAGSDSSQDHKSKSLELASVWSDHHCSSLHDVLKPLWPWGIRYGFSIFKGLHEGSMALEDA